MTISKEKFEKAITEAFKRGESWGTTYSTWFTPSSSDTLVKIEEAKKRAFEIVRVKTKKKKKK